jgi:phosphoribosylanthranilate isomerase
VAEVKFCGLTRAGDAESAAGLGAAYAGVIFAGGPRALDVPRARVVLGGLEGTATRTVGVFGTQPVAKIAWIADELALDVVQLHSGATPDRILELRKWHEGEIWAVVGVDRGTAGDLDVLVGVADGIVLDTSVDGRSGGTGKAFDWAAMAHATASLPAESRLVVAGGLRPGNVSEAIAVLRPDVVDVSSGVESSPGIKDPELMRAFVEMARSREE